MKWALLAEARSLWRRIDSDHITDSWRIHIPRLLVLLTAAQLVAARSADEYVTNVLEAQGINAAPLGAVRPGAFTESASDGRPLDTLLAQPVSTTLVALHNGETRSRAMAAGWATLDMILSTQVADGFRGSASVAMGVRPRCTQYVRTLVPPSCSRCVILAGTESWSTAFKRHPRCDCTAVPTDQFQSKHLTTNPKVHFENLSKAEQDRVFTKAGAQAIRDGADINRVVNARRRAAGLTPAQSRTVIPADVRAARGDFTRGRLRADGQGRFLTAELSGRQQGLVRPMPETIYAMARNRAEAIELLRKHRYITQ